jgi:hypothetical protein
MRSIDLDLTSIAVIVTKYSLNILLLGEDPGSPEIFAITVPPELPRLPTPLPRKRGIKPPRLGGN